MKKITNGFLNKMFERWEYLMSLDIENLSHIYFLHTRVWRRKRMIMIEQIMTFQYGHRRYRAFVDEYFIKMSKDVILTDSRIVYEDTREMRNNDHWENKTKKENHNG